VRTFSFSFVNTKPEYILTITRPDETVIHVTPHHKAITIGAVTWSPAVIEIGDMTNTNNGTLSNLSIKVGTQANGTFDPYEIDLQLFKDALVLIEITNAANPVSKDFEFVGKMNGNVQYDPVGNATFEVLNLYGTPRDIFIRKYTVEDQVDFGDPRRSKIPTFPSIDATTKDLHDVARLETIEVGDRRRFRFTGSVNPDAYANVYLEATSITTGITAAGAPTPSSTVGTIYVDGGVTWTTRNAYARAFQVASLIDTRHITITVTEPRKTDPTWYAPGRLIMRSGFCKNRVSVIDSWDGISQIELVEPFGNLLTVGDWGEIAPDYDQTLAMAVAKYGAAIGILADGGANNYRGFPHLTGSRISSSTFVFGTTVEFPPDGSGGGGGGGVGGYTPFAVEFAEGSS